MTKMNNKSMVKPLDVIPEQSERHEFKLIWATFINLIVVHVFAIIGFYYGITCAMPQTIIWFFFVGLVSGFGILAGAHRLWCHRSYKARTPLRILLMIMATLANQHDILEWCQDHRIHHKYSDTDADPYNVRRGFWWAQIVWVMYDKHPKYQEKCREIDFSDITSDPVVKFQLKYYWRLVFLIWGFIPTFVPWCFWSESFMVCLSMNMTRYALSLHQAGLVNSAAHLYGMKPYDKNIKPVENNLVTYFSMGEGYHNYHHVFPYDYSASEFGWASSFNPTTAFIDFFEKIGLAYDKKVVEDNTIRHKKQRTGDNTNAYPRFNLIFDYTLGFLTFTSWLWITFTIRSVLNGSN